MCAIGGWFKPDFGNVNKKRLFRHLARKMQSHGNKSFGVSSLQDGKMKTWKYTGTASTWLQQNDKELDKIANTDVLLIHTRLPTQGAVTKSNCHPFEIGSWVAAHNGCISNSDSLHNRARFVAKGETDSEEALCYVIGESFHKDSLLDIQGSFAFEAAKKDGSEVILVCDEMRSLHAVQFGAGMVWCTDEEILDSSLIAAGAPQRYVREKIEAIKNKILKLPSMESTEINRPVRTYGPGSWVSAGESHEPAVTFVPDTGAPIAPGQVMHEPYVRGEEDVTYGQGYLSDDFNDPEFRATIQEESKKFQS